MYKTLLKKIIKHRFLLINALASVVVVTAFILWSSSKVGSISKESYGQELSTKEVIDIYSKPTFAFVIGESGEKLNQPMGITVDKDGNIYVADSGNKQIKIFSATGKYLRTFGDVGLQAQTFNYPYGLIFLNQDVLLVGDPNKLTVEKYNKKGVFLGYLISAKEGIKPGDFYKDCKGNVYITDLHQNRILVYDSSENLLDIIQSNEFNFLQGTAKDLKGNLIIANSGENKISFINSTYKQLIREITGASEGRPGFSMIRGMAIDNFSRIIVTDTLINQLRFFTLEGKELFYISEDRASFRNLNFPTTVFTTKEGGIFVTDRGNNRILVWTTNVKQKGDHDE